MKIRIERVEPRPAVFPVLGPIRRNSFDEDEARVRAGEAAHENNGPTGS